MTVPRGLPLAIAGVLSLGCSAAPPTAAGAPVVVAVDTAGAAPPPVDAGEADAAAPVDAGSDAAPAEPPHTIRTVDWCRVGYPYEVRLFNCRGSRAVRHSAEGGIHSFEEFRFLSVTYGDLDGDGREDALVLIRAEQSPVIVGPEPPEVTLILELVELRGAGLYIYSSRTAADPPVVSITIAKGVATLVRRTGTWTCREPWRLVGESLTGGPCK